jgi:hypothetical protein
MSKMEVNNLVPTQKNLGGRPAGSRNKRTIFVESLFAKNAKDVRDIVATCIRLAKSGDADFAKLVLDRICPVRKGALLHFPLPPIRNMDDVKSALDGLLQATSQGLISSAEAVELSNVIDKLRQAIGDLDTEERLRRLEEAEARRAA